MGKLSKLRRDIKKDPEKYQKLIQQGYPGGVSIYKYKNGKTGISLYRWSRGYHHFIRSVLNNVS